MRSPAILLAALAVLSACADASRSDASSPFQGIALPAPLARPAFALPTTDGAPFEFARETAGTLTLLMFGYTHCPDICPVHLANLATVLRDLDAADRAKVRVVFVSVDPDRDSVAVIRRWLDQFDPTFIGLRGTLDEVNRVQSLLNLPQATITPMGDGRVEVGHATQVIAFTPDDSAHVMYPFGTRQAEWAHDLPLLLHGAYAKPSAKRDAEVPTSTVIAAASLRIRNAVVPATAAGLERAAYFAIENTGANDEVLLSVSAPGTAEWAMLHATVTDAAGRTQMTMLDSLVIPAGATVTLAPGVRHVMLAPSPTASRTGSALALQLTFRHTGVVTVPARIVAPGSVEPGTPEGDPAAPAGGHAHRHD